MELANRQRLVTILLGTGVVMTATMWNIAQQWGSNDLADRNLFIVLGMNEVVGLLFELLPWALLWASAVYVTYHQYRGNEPTALLFTSMGLPGTLFAFMSLV